MPTGTPHPASLPRNRSFATTRWSVVVAAAERNDRSEINHALASLCETYWPPLYGYVRRRVVDAHEAQELTQAFFCRTSGEKLSRRRRQTTWTIPIFSDYCLQTFSFQRMGEKESPETWRRPANTLVGFSKSRFIDADRPRQLSPDCRTTL